MPRAFLAFPDLASAQAFQASVNAALGYPTADGTTLRYDDVAQNFADGSFVHVLDDVVTKAGLLIPAQATLLADASTLQLEPTPVQRAQAEMQLPVLDAKGVPIAESPLLTAIANAAVADLSAEVIP